MGHSLRRPLTRVVSFFMHVRNPESFNGPLTSTPTHTVLDDLILRMGLSVSMGHSLRRPLTLTDVNFSNPSRILVSMGHSLRRPLTHT